MKNKYRITVIIYLVFIVFKTNAQNTTFNNVAIGTDFPTYGAKIKANFPGYTGGWGRAYFITNETGDQSFFTFGSSGYSTNGVSSVTSSFIGKDLESRYMTFLPNGNVGIGSKTPAQRLTVDSKQTSMNAGVPAKTGDVQNGIMRLQVDGNSWGEVLDFGMNVLPTYAWLQATNRGNLAVNYNLSINPNGGNVGIGTTTPAYKLDVIGTIRSREVKVDMNGADFVFEEKYPLMPLTELEAYVKKNKHLPEIAPAKEMQEQGSNLGDLNTKLLQKIEELTLYVIEQNKQLKLQSDEIEKQNQEFRIFKTKIKKLESKQQ